MSKLMRYYASTTLKYSLTSKYAMSLFFRIMSAIFIANNFLNASILTGLECSPLNTFIVLLHLTLLMI